MNNTDLAQIANNMKNLTALIVEDRQDDNEMMVNIFSSFFSEVYSAQDGVDGLKLYKKHKPDVVITDLIMPNKDGIEMISDIRKLNKEQIVVVVSASDDIEKITQTISLDVTSFINKPVELPKLADALDKVSIEIQKRKAAQTKAFTITIPLDLYDEIMEAAGNEHISKNGMIIRALKEYKFNK